MHGLRDPVRAVPLGGRHHDLIARAPVHGTVQRKRGGTGFGVGVELGPRHGGRATEEFKFAACADQNAACAHAGGVVEHVCGSQRDGGAAHVRRGGRAGAQCAARTHTHDVGSQFNVDAALESQLTFHTQRAQRWRVFVNQHVHACGNDHRRAGYRFTAAPGGGVGPGLGTAARWRQTRYGWRRGWCCTRCRGRCAAGHNRYFTTAAPATAPARHQRHAAQQQRQARPRNFSLRHFHS